MSDLNDLVDEVHRLTNATTELIDTTNIRKQDLDEAVDSASSDATKAETGALNSTQSAQQSEQSKIASQEAQIASEKARDDAEAIVYEGDASLEPKAGSIPIADSNAKLHPDWLPSLGAVFVPEPDVRAPLINNLKFKDGFADALNFKRASTDLERNTSGKFVIKQIDEPCFFKRGLQIYSSSTNLIIRSGAELASYGDDAATTAEVSLGAVSIIQYTGNAVSRRKGYTNVGSNGATYTFSCFIKPASTATVSVSTFDGSEANATIMTVTSTGELTVNQGSGHTVVNEGIERYGEYYRCFVTLTAASNYSIGSIYLKSDDAVAFGLTQAERLGLTTYIPTEASAVTRAATVPSLENYLNLPHFSDDMTIAITVKSPNPTYDWVTVYRNADGVFSIGFSAGNTVILGQASWNIFNRARYPDNGMSRNARFVVRKKGTTISLFVNGTLRSTTPDCIFSGETEGIMYLGTRDNGQRAINGTLSNLDIWHLALTDEQIQSLGVA